MHTKLFIAEHPFVVPKNKTTEADYLTDFFSDHDRVDEKTLRGVFLKFALQKKLAIVTKEQTLSFSDNAETGSWLWYLSYMNMRSLVDVSQFKKLMRALEVNDAEPLTDIIDLQVRLNSLFDRRIVNSIAHRTMQAIFTIPYGDPNNKEYMTWDTLHKQYPFLWIVIFLQVVLRSEIK